MLKGCVNLRAEITGTRLQFVATEFDPKRDGVSKVTLEGVDGDYLVATVHFDRVASEADGERQAAQVAESALDRIAYHYNTAITPPKVTGLQLSPVEPLPGVAYPGVAVVRVTAQPVRVKLLADPAQVRTVLEQEDLPGERYYCLFRTAMLSLSQVEAFMHFYNLLLLLQNDNQGDVDGFIVSQDPTVPQTQAPKRRAGCLETVYTRLRNEFAHPRSGVELAATKTEMAKRLGDLQELTKKAIASRT